MLVCVGVCVLVYQCISLNVSVCRCMWASVRRLFYSACGFVNLPYVCVCTVGHIFCIWTKKKSEMQSKMRHLKLKSQLIRPIWTRRKRRRGRGGQARGLVAALCLVRKELRASIKTFPLSQQPGNLFLTSLHNFRCNDFWNLCSPLMRLSWIKCCRIKRIYTAQTRFTFIFFARTENSNLQGRLNNRMCGLLV